MTVYTILLALAWFLPIISTQKIISASVGTIKGETIKDGQLHRFLGIPYAEAPVDKLRFTKPQKLANFEYTYDANRHRSFCPQLLLRDNVWNSLPVSTRSDEDCLYLNVYVPERNVKLPVMVFLDGDSFLSGRGDVYDGEELAVKGDVIVITLNYRLGVLGFLATGEENAPGNIGLWDQNLALHWVQDNIGAFGGDPNRVTLVGWSAGATSAALHALSEQSKGLFSRVVLQGGGVSGPTPIITKEEAVEFAKKLGIQTNCYKPENTKPLAEMLDCMQDSVKYNPTLLIFQSLTIARADPVRGFLNAVWAPVIDGIFLKDHPAKLLSDKNYLESVGFNNLDIMLGVTRNEGTLLNNILQMSVNPVTLNTITTNNGIATKFMVDKAVPALVQGRLGSESIPTQEYVEREYNIQGEFTSYSDAFSLYTDSYFVAPILEIAQAHSSSSNPETGSTYLYLFDHSAAVGKADVPHGGELPYVFGLSDLVSLANQVARNVTGSSPQALQEQAFSDTVVSYWSNFIKSGNPNTPKSIEVDWPTYSGSTKVYMKLSLDGSIAENLRGAAMSFWIDCFPIDKATVLNAQCPTNQVTKTTTTTSSPTTTTKDTVNPVTSKDSQAGVTSKATGKPLTRRPGPAIIIIDDPDNSCISLKSSVGAIALGLVSLFSIKYLVRF